MTKIYCWGLSKNGQAGPCKDGKVLIPQLIQYDNKLYGHVIDISAGGLFTAAITDRNYILSFGCGKYGRLAGSVNEEDSKNIVAYKFDDSKNLLAISCGLWHACILTQCGSVYVWGYSKACGSTNNVQTPQKVDLLNVIGITCGNNFTLCWTVCGKAYSWGVNNHGVLGHGNSSYKIEDSPKEITGLCDHLIVQMSAGTSHCGAVTKDGNLFVWGNNKYGALGIVGETKDILKPKLVDNVSNVKQISCNIGDNHGHSLLITTSGRLFASGDGYKGKLGLGNFNSSSIFQNQSKINFVQVCSGGIHSAGVSDAGELFTWGCGSDGRLGHPEAAGHRYLYHSSIPKAVEAFSKKRVLKVSASYYHTVALVQ
ncbi:probable E3 ubiquitin-protein ligase HERC4 [Hydra vulgaris]|uniref:Probable E3 ubiquitin-protein ligase HERC4 n=1 Tax=Hydra vulgaris TaxID=6087 RepID=A0ABM4D8Y2_HYDVU